jgi:hypothetical protein
MSIKQAVSVSLGSAKRDKSITIELLGQRVTIERQGTDGDVDLATQRFTALDGLVDALGVGGIDLWVQMGEKQYPLHAAQKMIRRVHQTPVVDGSGLKNTLERQVVPTLIQALGKDFKQGRVLLTAAVDRYGMTLSFAEHGYELVCGDLMFALGLPIPVRSLKSLRRMGRILLPIVGRLPISVLYPTGGKQEAIIPKYERYYDWATVIAGDCHYIKRHMPDKLEGKVIVTNTTTEADIEMFRERGVRAVLTSTPTYDGRSFGANMMEAAITAVAGKNRPLTLPELEEIIHKLELKPTVQRLDF